MLVKFSKYHGCGNDFIIIDNRKNEVHLSQKNIANMCHRNFGIGADGLMLLENDKNSDFRMTYFNSDGFEGTMCGNGGRCITAFSEKLGIINQKTKFIAIDGLHEAEIFDNFIALKMADLSEIETIENDFYLNTGSPHYVKFIDDFNAIDVFNDGRKIRNSNLFKKEGTNVNFAKLTENKLKVGTYERCVENETLSCGTGVTAVAICAWQKSNKKYTNFDIETKGGNLKVSFDVVDNTFKNIWLKGPATFVFSGEYYL